MDRVSERERSSRKARDERERERDHHRDRDRDRDHKHRHRHSEKDEEDKRHGSREEKHRRSRAESPDDHGRSKNEKHRNDDRRHRSRADSLQDVEPRRERSPVRFGGSTERSKDEKRQSRADSPQDLERRGERSYSIERSKEDKLHDKDSQWRSRAASPLDLEPRHERSSAEYRDSVERPKDEKDRDLHHHSRTDSPHDHQPMHEQSSDGFRDSVERGGGSREQSTERHHHSSRKRKVHDGNEDDADKRGKRARASDGMREERRERRRFEDRVMEDADDLNGGYRDKRMEEKISKDKKKEIKPTHKERDREEIKVKKEEFSDEEDRIVRRERRRFSDITKVQEKRDEKDMIKDEDSESVEEAKPSLLLGSSTNGGPSNTASEKGGSTSNVVSQEPLTLASKVSMISSASYHPYPTKVSSITTTNENVGVSITRSDEVPGKSSTDGTTNSVAGRSGSLTLDALAKAKKALQIQKELKEKLKKIPMLNKPAIMGTDNSSQAALSKDGLKVSVLTTTAAAKLVVGASTSENPPAAADVGVVPGLTTIPNIEAVKRAQELAAKMGFRQDPEFAPLINMFPGPSAADVAIPQKPTKAPVLRLDAQGREIDEHGNVINMPKLTNLSTLKVNINKQKKEAFQILGPELDGNTESNPYFDARMGIDKTKLLRPKRMSFQFVEEGRWSKQAEIIKFKSQFGEAQAKELKLKQSQLAKAKTEVDNPNLIELPDRVDRIPRDRKKDDIPDIEWWDKPLLSSGGYIDVTGDGLNLEKITIYVEHPRPIEPPADPAPPPPQPLKLTKKEQKKLRTQRRLAKERDRQEMIRQGLLEPPKPKVKMSNLMKVLGSEATQDPTRLEMEVRSAAAEREQAHVDRNIARKLTPAERREKKERKLFEDPNALETIVSVYKVNDLSHPQTRFKVDVNAQENRLTGVAVISDGITVVVVEGGKKSIKRYGKLMLKRINWAAAVNEEEGAENVDAPVNSCVLVWQGSVAKSSFYRFIIHQCRTEAAAKKVFADAGVPHYWDLAINFSELL